MPAADYRLCADSNCPPVEACCTSVSATGPFCKQLIPIACTALGGVLGALNSTCEDEPNPCITDESIACCFVEEVDGVSVSYCQMMHPTDCAAACGIPQSGENCDGIGCPPFRGCCIGGSNCQNLYPDCCVARGGVGGDEGSVCGTCDDIHAHYAFNDELPINPLPPGEEPPPQQLISGDDLPPPPGEPLPAPTIWTDREYVYGPDYVDEFIAQFDREGNIIYMLQDANYNVVALVDVAGALLEQYTWEPYGTLVAVERDEKATTTIVTGFVNRVGHQGLFFDRFGGRYEQYSLIVRESEAGPDFATGAKGLYYNRNRFYSPSLGRFTSRDPNETALPILAAMARNGERSETEIQRVKAVALYHDGLSNYLYCRSNPIMEKDPAGLMTFIDIIGAQGLANDMTAQDVDMAMGLLQAEGDIVKSR